MILNVKFPTSQLHYKSSAVLKSIIISRSVSNWRHKAIEQTGIQSIQYTKLRIQVDSGLNRHILTLLNQAQMISNDTNRQTYINNILLITEKV
jgi:hypothetical protein